MSKTGTSISTEFGMTIPFRAFHINTWVSFRATSVVSFEIETHFIYDSSMDTEFSVNNIRFKQLNSSVIFNPLAFKEIIVYTVIIKCELKL